MLPSTGAIENGQLQGTLDYKLQLDCDGGFSYRGDKNPASGQTHTQARASPCRLTHFSLPELQLGPCVVYWRVPDLLCGQGTIFRGQHL